MRLLLILALLCHFNAWASSGPNDHSIDNEKVQEEFIIDHQYLVSGYWLDEGPFVDAFSRYVLLVKDVKTKKPVNLQGDYRFSTWMIMPMGNGSHGHPGGGKIEIDNTTLGRYELSKIYFYAQGMKGVWQLNLTLDEAVYTLGILKI